MFQPQVIQSYPHGTRGAGCVRELALEAVALSALHDEQVELGAAVRRPDVRCAGLERAQELLDREPLEGGAHLRVIGDFIRGLQGA